jgi:hypothetical protein
MARQQRFGVLSPLILVVMTTLFLTGCVSRDKEPELKVVTKIEKTIVPVVARPKPVQLNDVKVHVVNEANYEDFVKKFKEENGQLAYVALSMRDYENLALNVAELRRFINQQINIIVYYEDAVTDDKPEESVDNGTESGESK